MPEERGATCPNCGTPAPGRYCPQCGQVQREVRITLWRWLLELAEEFSLTAKLPRTLWLLVSRPGLLAEEWRQGRRVRYVSPLRLYILASVVFFSVTFFVGLPFGGRELELGLDDFSTSITGTTSDMVNAVIAGRMRGFLTLGSAASVPLVALWLLLLRGARERLYVDHLVFSLHLHSTALFAFTVAWVALFFGTPGYVVAALMAAYVLIYWVVAWWRTYRREGRPVKSTLLLGVTSGGLGVIALGLLIGELVIGVSMTDSTADISNVEVGNAATGAARSAYWAGDFSRSRHLADLAVQAFQRVDTAALIDHLPFHAAEAHRFAEQYEEARTRAAALYEADSTDLLSLGLAAVSAEAMGDSAAAGESYERLLTAVDGGATNTKGHEASFNRYLHAARVFLDRATPADLRQSAFRTYQRARYTASEGDTVRARDLAAEALALFGDPRAELQDHDAFHRAEMHDLLGRHDSVLTALRPLIGADTTHVLALGLAGSAAEATGDTAAARRYYERMLQGLDEGVEPLSGHEAVFRRVEGAARRYRE